MSLEPDGLNSLNSAIAGLLQGLLKAGDGKVPNGTIVECEGAKTVVAEGMELKFFQKLELKVSPPDAPVMSSVSSRSAANKGDHELRLNYMITAAAGAAFPIF